MDGTAQTLHQESLGRFPSATAEHSERANCTGKWGTGACISWLATSRYHFTTGVLIAVDPVFSLKRRDPSAVTAPISRRPFRLTKAERRRHAFPRQHHNSQQVAPARYQRQKSRPNPFSPMPGADESGQRVIYLRGGRSMARGREPAPKSHLERGSRSPYKRGACRVTLHERAPVDRYALLSPCGR